MNTDELTQNDLQMLEVAEPLTDGIAKRFNVHTLTDAMVHREPEPYIVQDLLKPKTLVVIYGEGGTKKSTTMSHLGLCVASGKSWMIFETNPARVLYINEDMNDDDFSDMIKKEVSGLEIDPTIPFYYSSYPGLNLSERKDEGELTLLIQYYQAKLVILDTLSNIMAGDENSKKDTQPIFEALKRIAEKTGAAFIIIHHSNKQGGYRGSTAIKNSVDRMIKTESASDSGLISFETEKNRFGKPVKFSAFAHWEDDKITLSNVAYERREIYSPSEDYVLSYFREHGPSTVKAVEDGSDRCTAAAARRALYYLAEKGKIERTNPGEKTAIYAMCEVCDV